jgi:hypothetical protein
VASCAARLDAAASAQRAWACAALARASGGAAPRAWLLSPGLPPPCDAALALIQEALSTGKELAHGARLRALSALASLPPLPPAGEAGGADADATLDAGLHALACAAALLAHARLCCAGDVYCACADAVMAECAAYAEAARTACQQLRDAAPQAARHGDAHDSAAGSGGGGGGGEHVDLGAAPGGDSL